MPQHLQNIAEFREIEFLTGLMDDRFSLFGYRFGINFLIGMVPEIGDMVSTLIALYIFALALKYKISFWTAARMVWNIAIYFLVGLIPWLGDIFGTWWKPNRRNLELLQNAVKSL